MDITTMARFIAILALCLAITTEQQIPLNLPSPTYTAYKKAVTTVTVDQNKIMSLIFDHFGYEISSELYLVDGVLTDQQLFDKAVYTVAPDQYCELYSTNTDIIQRASAPYLQQLQPLKYLIHHQPQQSHAYILGSNSILYRYRFDKINLKLIQEYPLNSTITGIVGQQMLANMQLVLIQDVLLLVNANESYIIYEGNVLEHVGRVEGYAGVDRVVGAGAVGSMLWVCSDYSLYVYQVVFDSNTSQKTAQFVPKSVHENITTDTISAVVYDDTTHQFYIVSAQKLIILLHQPSTNSNTSISTTYQINGHCQQVKKIKNVLYLMCQYQKLNFIAEILILPNMTNTSTSTPILNRYYDESLLEGIRNVQGLGFDKIVLVGDEEVILIGEAVNRNTLLKLQKMQKQQYYEVMSSFGLIDLAYLHHYSTAAQSTLLVINQKQVKVVSILYDPPEIQCVLSREDFGATASLLVVFNATHCPLVIPTEFKQAMQLGGTLTLCQVLFPIQINIATKQYEQKSAFFIMFLAMVFIGALILVFVGFGIQIRRKANQVIQSIQANIKKMQQAGKKKKNIDKI